MRDRDRDRDRGGFGYRDGGFRDMRGGGGGYYDPPPRLGPDMGPYGPPPSNFLSLVGSSGGGFQGPPPLGGPPHPGSGPPISRRTLLDTPAKSSVGGGGYESGSSGMGTPPSRGWYGGPQPLDDMGYSRGPPPSDPGPPARDSYSHGPPPSRGNYSAAGKFEAQNLSMFILHTLHDNSNTLILVSLGLKSRD